MHTEYLCAKTSSVQGHQGGVEHCNFFTYRIAFNQHTAFFHCQTLFAVTVDAKARRKVQWLLARRRHSKTCPVARQNITHIRLALTAVTEGSGRLAQQDILHRHIECLDVRLAVHAWES